VSDARVGAVGATHALLALAGAAALAARALLPAGKPVPACCAPTDEGRAAPAGEGIPVLGEVPDFSFTERSGRTVARKDLLGRIWVADFIFTSCAGTCPVMTSRMAGVHQALLREEGAVCVSFSVDPDRDTLSALRAYADRFSATADGWWFLRGPQKEVHALEYGGFKMGDPEDPMIHSERFVLVDGAGRIRGWYRGTEAEEVSRLLADVRRLRGERP
jgi:protein SCO1